MPSIFISGIPKGLDRETTSRRIKRDIETVAQVRTIWIQKEKGYGFVSLHDETSADFVLSLNEQICINGNALRITRWRRTSRQPETPRRTTAQTCKQQVNNDVFVLRGYDTYTNYRCHRPQSDVLYQYIQQAPKQKQLKRKPWKDMNRVSQLSSPKSRKNVRAKRRKSKKKITRHTKIKHSTSPSEVGLHSVSERQKRSKFNLSNLPTCFTRKASRLKSTSESNIETENINQKLVDSIHTRASASVHVYDHSKRLFSIEVDNNNVLESIKVGLSNKGSLPSDDTILISHNGKTVNNQWQPHMANDDNIHIVVKGKGGMMQGDPPGKGHNADDEMETKNNDRTTNTDDTASHTEKYVNKSEQNQNIQASVMTTHLKEDSEITDTGGTRSATDESVNKTQQEQQIPANVTAVNQDNENREPNTGNTRFAAEESIGESVKKSQQKQALPAIDMTNNPTEGNVITSTGDTGYTVEESVNQSEQKQQIPANVTVVTPEDDKGKPNTGNTRSTGEESINGSDQSQQMSGSRAQVAVNEFEQEKPLPANGMTNNPTKGNMITSTGDTGYTANVSVNQSDEDGQNTPSTLHQVAQSLPFLSTFSQLSEDYQAILIDELDLRCSFPDQLTYASVMAISDCEKDEADTLADIPRLILHKLIMLDFTSRENDLNICLTNMKRLRDDPSVKCEESNSPISNEEFDAMFDNDKDIQEKSISNLDRRSPVDIFLSIFICLHPTLKQKICLKMFACHLAIPIIFPVKKHKHQETILMFSMWPLRSITVHDGKIDTSIVNCKQNIVSFIRLGRPQISKSKLANELLFDTAHNAFFNYDCLLGSSEKQASVGLVEASWFLPSPKQPRDLQRVTVFLNLRGDALNNAEQTEYLKSVSHVMIIVTDKETMKNKKDLDYFKRAHFNVLFLLTGEVSTDFIRKYKQHYMDSSPDGFNAEFISGSEHGKNIGLSEVKEAIVNIIGPFLNGSNSAITIQEMCDQARLMGIAVDEDMPKYKSGRKAANNIFDQVKECPLADIKVKYTPLQKENWQNYTDVMKLYRKPGSDFQEKAKLEQKMELQQSKQWDSFKTGKPFITDFIDIFLTLDGDSLVYFLDSLKFELDEKSRREMPNYRESYAAAWNECKSKAESYAAAWKECQSKAEADKVQAQQEVSKAEQKLSDASFGIEHIFRELGQVYEASLVAEDKELCTNLAKAVARSIKLGYPFELMDGDVANVPLKWVERVFEELQHMLGDKRLLTLSILGLQSSGKSTLLNAMFGLTFSVSAGRCTRGIYVQLFPVREQKFKFDYVLVVDTEGLRAPELGEQKYQHDNELATLVLGMADITIVNIKGENTSEVKDILQICVHAFLRLKMANQSLQLRQSCIFIHQNVSDVTAKDSMMHARKKLAETLDRMTLEAAEEENISDIKCFKDVIKFDSNHHVWYFSDLWKGDPPMAPANPGYSRDVREVKSFIFRTLTQNKDSYLTISDSFNHIKDLWNGILANDFVFCFRNSLEIRAYNALEIIYQDLIWELEKYAKHLTNSAEIEMKQCTADCETDIVKGRGIDQYTGHIHNKYPDDFQKKQSELKRNLKNHFEKGDKKHEIAKWKHSKLLAWDSFAEDCLGKLKRQLTDIESHFRVDYEMNTSLTNLQNEIYDQATTLAGHMKGKRPSNLDMEAGFNEMWDKWIRKIYVKEEHSIEVKVVLESIIFETFNKHRDVVETEMNKHPIGRHPSFITLENSLNHFGFDDNYISVKKTMYKRFKDAFVPGSKTESEIHNEAIGFTNIILKNIGVIFRDLEKREWKFDATEMKEIPKRIMQRIYQHNHDKSKTFTLLEPYTVTLCVHVFRFALPLLKRLDAEYMKKYSVKAKLSNHKAVVWRHFQDVVDEKSATLIACDRFCEIIRDHVEEKIKSSLPDLIYDHIVTDFMKAKYALMNRIMEDLVKINELKAFMSYVHDPYTYAFEWLSEYIDSKCFGRSGNMYMDKVSAELQTTFEVIENSVERKSASCLHDWLVNVQSEMKRGMVWIQMKSFFVVENQKITDLNDFIATVKRKLVQVRSELKGKFQSETETSIRWYHSKTPYQISMDKLWGCKAVCPFCYEPCQWNDKHTGDHSCIQHRARGVAGGWWIQTDILILESCSFQVQSDCHFQCSANCEGICTGQGKTDESHPTKAYKKYFPVWNIHPCSEISSAKYWEWVFCTYNEELAKHYNKKKATIPQSWKKLTKDDAIKSLKEFA